MKSSLIITVIAPRAARPASYPTFHGLKVPGLKVPTERLCSSACSHTGTN